MATKTTSQRHKADFVREQLTENPEINLAQMNAAWQAAGHEGQIVGSTFYNTKTKMRRAQVQAPIGTNGHPRPLPSPVNMTSADILDREDEGDLMADDPTLHLMAAEAQLDDLVCTFLMMGINTPEMGQILGYVRQARRVAIQGQRPR